MNETNQKIELIVNQNNAKTSYITTMYTAARERSIILLRMLGMDDPFEIDEEYLYYNELATKFALARIAMGELPYDEQEEAYSSEQYILTQQAMPYLENVIELIMDDEREEATKMLLDQAIPAQDLVLEQLHRMLVYQDKTAKKSLLLTKKSHQKAVRQISILALGALMLSIAIAWFIYNYANRAKGALFAQVTLESIGDAVITADADGKINYLNPIAESMTGYLLDDAKGKVIDEVFCITEDKIFNNFQNNIDESAVEDQPLSTFNQSKLKSLDGTIVAIDYSLTPIIDTTKKHVGTALIFRDINQEHLLREQLSFQACHDALTGLINRYEFEKRLTGLVKDSINNTNKHALLYIDLDEFKVVNDTCGHVAGDELLRQIPTVLNNRVRTHDTIARLGGDEFGILLENCSEKKAMTIATDILHAIQDFHFAWDERTFRIGSSIGVVEINEQSKDLANVLSIADAACYSAKDGGRNRVHVARENDSEIESRRGEMKWVSRITEALESDNFELYYQLIVPAKEMSVVKIGIEFLIRMKGDDGSLILPGAFIPAAERYNLMARLDRWVIEHAITWLASNEDVTASLDKCAINLSGHSLGDENFLDFIKDTITKHQIDPERICFEITETAAISNLVKAISFINELRSLGCSFSLDDFGSGLSSFAYLKNLPVDFIKIDGMFVRDIAHDSIDQEMVKSITAIAQAMGKLTIAEFVENDDIKEILQEFGVDFIQGYGVAKPQALDKLTLDSITLLKEMTWSAKP